MSFVQPFYVSYLDQYTQTFSAITKSIMGLTGYPRVIIVVMICRGGFVLARMEVCGKFWFVKVYFLSNSNDSALLKVLFTLFHNYIHGSKKYFCFKLIAT